MACWPYDVNLNSAPGRSVLAEFAKFRQFLKTAVIIECLGWALSSRSPPRGFVHYDFEPAWCRRCGRKGWFGGTIMFVSNLPMVIPSTNAWNHGRIIGQKRPLLPKHVWAIRVRLELVDAVRDLALFNMAIDSKLRGCDFVRLKVTDVFASCIVKGRTSVLQSKTKTPVRFEITEGTRKSLANWISASLLGQNCNTPATSRAWLIGNHCTVATVSEK